MCMNNITKMDPNNTTQQVKTYSNETEKTLNILEFQNYLII